MSKANRLMQCNILYIEVMACKPQQDGASAASCVQREADQLRDQRGQGARYWPPFAPWVQ
jgi:hypothetical protein